MQQMNDSNRKPSSKPPNNSSSNADKHLLDTEFGGSEARRVLEKRLLRKLDLRMGILVFIYILNYIDRNNAAAARLRGFEEDLGLTKQQFPTLLSILYVGYILMQIPSNMFLNYIGKPSIYLPACMLIWGMISVLTGITQNFVGALLTRFFLGFVEAAFFPGALFLLSKWYKRDELGLRTAILYCGNLSSNAFGGLLAAGILDGMQGKLGHAAWRWLFFIEGALTMGVAVLAIFILPDFPSTTKWLSNQEKLLAEVRMAEDVGGEVDKDPVQEGHIYGFLLAMKDWKVWWFAVTLTAITIGLSFNAYFPLTATLGYSRNISLLLCAPPWAFATIIGFLNARHADKSGERFFHVAIPLFLGLVGFIVAIVTMNTAARYISLFLMAQSYAGLIVLLSWVSNSIPRPPAKRAVALAFINAFSQLGNVAGSYVWPKGWGPTYRKSYAICIGCFVLAIAMAFGMRVHLISLNKRLDQGEEVEGIRQRNHAIEEVVKSENVSVEELGAGRKGFRFFRLAPFTAVSPSRLTTTVDKKYKFCYLNKRAMPSFLSSLRSRVNYNRYQRLPTGVLNPDTIEPHLKPGPETLNHISSNLDGDEPGAEFGGPEARRVLEKRLLRKLDLRMSILVLIYILNYIDRNNAAAARLRGFEEDLGLTKQQFPTLLSILYIGYILMQVPSNMFLNYMGRPSIYLPMCMLIWGMLSALTGITHNFTEALLARFFLGFVEAAFFPGALFLLSKWYKRDELGLRTAILFCGNLSSNAFGGLLAAGILDVMQGKLGLAAWRWLFLIEGTLTMGVAVLALFILPDFPSNTKWLSDQERRLAEVRMAEDVGEVDKDSAQAGHLSTFCLAMKDWKVWWFAVTLTAITTGLSFNAYFPLTATLGYSRNISLLLCAPPWAFATVVGFINAHHADKSGERFLHVTVPIFIGIIGFIIAISTMNTAARYASLFLMAQSYAGLIVLVTWVSNSILRPPAKRAVALAFINAFSQSGNIMGSYAWPKGWGPTYRKSYAICIGTFALAIVMAFGMRVHLISLNKQLDQGEEIEGMNERTDEVEDAAELENATVELRARRKGFRFLY